MTWVLGMLLFIGYVSGHFTDEVNARLPRYFLLDDYDRCISQKDGLYCLGTFELSPIHPSPTYELIKEYSSSPLAFNRSRLHRGYCVSARCPSQERNASLRFERCVEFRARRLALSARLLSLQHCTARAQHKARAQQPPAASLLLFQNLIVAVLALNAVGTVYDVATGDNKKKIGVLTAWSVRSSWRRLTAIQETGDPRFKDLEFLHGVRVVPMLVILYTHCNTFHYQYYVTNPQSLEVLNNRADGVVQSNGTSLVQMFAMLSSFLAGYSLLVYSDTNRLSLAMLPLIVIKRVVRLAPVHLLLIGFTATVWPRILSGPFYYQAEAQSAICHRKFWSHVFFYNNMVDKHEHCLIPTWFIPVDMHLYILSCILVILLQHRRSLARKLFGIGFFVSSIACGVVSYFTGWQALIFFAVPDNIRGYFSNVESFGEFYISTWAALPACFLGLYMAYLYYDIRETKYSFADNQLVKQLHNFSLPLAATWLIYLGSSIRHYKHPLIIAAYIIVDRPFIVVIAMFFIIGGFKIDGFWRRLGTWNGWRVLARLSLPVMLCHWLVNNYIVARPAAYRTSVFDLTTDFLATAVYTHLIAVPISLLVEIPAQRFMSQFYY